MSLSKTFSDSRIYVGNLPQFVRQRDLEDHFDRYGKVRAVDIHSRFDPAFAFIEFDDSRDAEDAVYGEDGKRFDGNRIKVQFPRGTPRQAGASRSGRSSYTRGRPSGERRGPPERTDHRITVSGLPASGSWQDLKDHMREAGEVVYADVYKDGTAVCEFRSYDDMKWAIKNLDDTKFKSHENETAYITIKRDRPRRSRSRSRTRSRSRSPRRSRSRSRSPKDRSRSPSRSPQRSRSRSPSHSRSRSRTP